MTDKNTSFYVAFIYTQTSSDETELRETGQAVFYPWYTSFIPRG